MSFITVPPMPPDHLGEVRRTSLMGGRGSRVTADGCRLLDVLTGQAHRDTARTAVRPGVRPGSYGGAGGQAAELARTTSCVGIRWSSGRLPAGSISVRTASLGLRRGVWE